MQVEGVEITNGGQEKNRWLLVALIVVSLLTGSYGIAKLFVQKANLPAYAVRHGQSFDGFPSIDHYAYRADLIRKALTRDDFGWEEVRAEYRSGLHSASILMPLFVALLAVVIGSIPASFAALSILAHLVSAWLIARIVDRLLDVRGSPYGPMAAMVFLAHVLTIRTSAQFYMDPFCNVWALIVVLFVVRLWERLDRATYAILVAALCTSVLIKVSLLPLLVVPVIAPVVYSKSIDYRRLVLNLCLCVALPLFVLVGWGIVLGDWHSVWRDMGHLSNQYSYNWSHLKHFTIEMALLFQLFPLLLILFPPKGRGARVMIVSLGLILLTTWGFSLPPIPRLYLPVLSLTVVLVVLGLARRFQICQLRSWLAIYASMNYAIATVGLIVS